MLTLENVQGSFHRPTTEPETAFNELSKTVKFNFGAMRMVGIAPVSDLTIQRREVIVGSCGLGGEYSKVITKSVTASIVGIQRPFQNGEIQLCGNAYGRNSSCFRFDAAARGGKRGELRYRWKMF